MEANLGALLKNAIFFFFFFLRKRYCYGTVTDVFGGTVYSMRP